MNNDLINKQKEIAIKKINSLFINSCREGNIDEVKELLLHGKSINSLSDSNLLDNTENINIYPNINNKNSYGLYLAAKYGQLEVVKFLTTSFELKELADIEIDNNKIFLAACKNGHVDVIDFLLTSPDIKNPDIHAQNDEALKLACEENHVSTVRFLTSSKKLKEHIKIDSRNYLCFIRACCLDCTEVISYFIFEKNLPLTEQLQVKIYDFVKNDDDFNKIIGLFQKRNLFAKMNNEFENKYIFKQSNKI